MSHRNGVFCGQPACTEPAFRGELCAGHTKQRQRRGHLTELRRPYESAWDRVADAWLEYAAADSDEDFEKAKARARKAMLDWALTLPSVRRRLEPTGQGSSK